LILFLSKGDIHNVSVVDMLQPTVFYDHLYDFGMHDQIADLLKARIRSGIKCRSPVRILHATMEGYAAVIEDRLCMKIGHLDWSPAKENNLQGRWGRTLDRGTDYQVWEKER
jgi:alpha-amylase